jgi:hypothetical protein
MRLFSKYHLGYVWMTKESERKESERKESIRKEREWKVK